MVTGEDVTATCQRCLHEEANGVMSRRQLELRKFTDFDSSFVEKWTAADGHLQEGTPTWMVILRLGNRCNLVCRMCGPSSSSAWYKEWQATRHRGFTEDGQRLVLEEKSPGVFKAHPDVYDWTEDEKVLNFIKTCGEELRRLHFSGGEPLLSRGHLEILKHLVQSGRAKSMSLEYNTNLSILPDEILELWSQFECVELGISADGPPQVNEYIRYPLKNERFLTHLRKLDQSQVSGRFWIATTVQIYNILYLQDLSDWLAAQNFKKIHREISWHILRAPKELSIFALPLEAKKQVARRLENTVFAPIREIILSQDESVFLPEFFASTQKMDQFRNQSWQDLPELKELLSAYCP